LNLVNRYWRSIVTRFSIYDIMEKYDKDKKENNTGSIFRLKSKYINYSDLFQLNLFIMDRNQMDVIYFKNSDGYKDVIKILFAIKLNLISKMKDLLTIEKINRYDFGCSSFSDA